MLGIVKRNMVRMFEQHRFCGASGIKSALQSRGKDVDPVTLKHMTNVTKLLPFNVNEHILSLVDWDNYLDDPIFKLTFPNPDMLTAEEHEMFDKRGDAEAVEIIKQRWNPVSSGQDKNVPKMIYNGQEMSLPGVQHKYEQTALFFHQDAQACFSYCNYCFRWPQFHQAKNTVKFGMSDPYFFFKYLEAKPKITDVLITGGDPMTAKASVLSDILLPFIDDNFSKVKYGEKFDLRHIQNIRIGTRALTYAPTRFTKDDDTSEILHLFERINRTRGKQLYVMCHLGHYREFSDESDRAVKALKNAGCLLRSQSPCIRNINDKSEVWVKKWKKEARIGIVPYYFFIARETGPKSFFDIPLVKLLDIFRGAKKEVSGLMRTCRGPSMSATPGKIGVVDVMEVEGKKAIALQFWQGRNKDWTDKVFFAKYDEKASWVSELKPLNGDKFFFEDELEDFLSGKKRH